MDCRDVIEKTLNRVRPFLRADGGDIDLVDVDGDDIVVRLTGACSGCPRAALTLHFGIEDALRVQLPHVRLRSVE